MGRDLDNELHRVVGGLRCIDVLEDLPDYLDGSLGAYERERVEAHLAGCDNCARFGSVYLRAVAAMRGLAAAPGGDETSSEPRR